MTAGIGNPVGAVILNDFSDSKIIGGLARAVTISGGVFVFGSTAAGIVSSGADSFVLGDLLFAPNASGLQFNGIALATAGSNQAMSVLTEGICIVLCDGTVTTGQNVVTIGHNAVSDGVTAGNVIGRALTAGASGGYAVVHIRA
jgi:hypothetical protein